MLLQKLEPSINITKYGEPMLNYDEQVRMFKDSIPIGPKTIPELVDWLRKQVDIKEIPLSALPGRALQTAKHNAMTCILNDGLQLKPDDMSFLAFEVKINPKSSRYSDTLYDHNMIYVVFEEHNGYIFSNSNRLFFDLEFIRGVSQHELDTEGNEFRSLLSHLAISYCEEHNILD